MSAMRLSKKEIERVEALVTRLCASQEALEENLSAQFGPDYSNVLSELEAGVDSFYELFRGKLDGSTLRTMLLENMKGMTKKQSYTYLTNLLLALTQVCGNVVEGPEWNEMLDGHKAIIDELESGSVSEDDIEVLTGIDDLVSQITMLSDSFSVLFIGDTPYEELLEACLTQKPEEVEALAANTRSTAVNTAAALYMLQERGELPSLSNANARIAPRDMGVMSASLLEIDAAHKSGSWEYAKGVIEKAARAAASLLVASPVLVRDTVTVFALLYLLTSFSTLWMLIGGAVLLINARMHIRQAKNHLEPILQSGARVLNVTLDKVRNVCISFRSWISNTVIPTIIPVWQRFRDYAINKVLLPVTALVLQAKPQLSEKAKAAIEKVNAFFRNVQEHAAAFTEAARNYSPSPVSTVPFSSDHEEEETTPDIDIFSEDDNNQNVNTQFFEDETVFFDE